MRGQPWAVSGAWALQGLGQVGQPDVLPQALGTVVALSRGPGPSRVRRRTGKGGLAVSLTPWAPAPRPSSHAGPRGSAASSPAGGGRGPLSRAGRATLLARRAQRGEAGPGHTASELRPGAGTCGPPPALLRKCPPRGPGGWAHRASRDGVGGTPPGCVRGRPRWGHAPQRRPPPPGERALPSTMAPPWGPGGHPGGAGGLRVAEPLLAATPPGAELLAGCACCLCPVMAVSLGADEVPVIQRPSTGQAGGAAGTALEGYRWGPASLPPPTWRGISWCSRLRGPRRLQGARSPGGSGHSAELEA